MAGALAYWLNERRKAANEEPPPPHVSKTFEDPELAERTRKIREEIQRKIEQRSRGGGYVEPRAPVAQPETPTPPPVIREVVPARSSARFDVQRHAEILEQQAAMMERLREAEVMKAGAEKRTEFEKETADHNPELLAKVRANVLQDLRDPAALRQAFILREIIGPPVALR